MNERDAVLNTILRRLEPLFEKAKNDKLWFYCSYQSLWFSPAELRREHENGKFIWGAENWKLRDPQERIAQYSQQKVDLENRAQEFAERVGEMENSSS